ncbi:MAG: hypothetical protein K0R57_4878 [Paenibacillaceae bacterium]|jgi:two-component system response regulator YesN|nr:hypothetical protein [Paenibacillaceae bacterium]
MYRILVVDDEPYVVDSLEEMLADAYSGRLDVCKAYSVEDAIALLDRSKADIVISDVRMPGMGGLALHREIRKRWPACKVIFLTGYDDFGYIQDSLRTGGVVDFILKMEEDERVLAAVNKAIGEIEAQTDHSRALSQARYRLKEAVPLLQQEYWLHLLREPPDSLAAIDRQFAALDIPFSGEEPVLVIAGKVDRWQEDVTWSDKSLLLYAIANIAQELLGTEVRFAQANWDYNSLVWFLQPGDRRKQGTGTEPGGTADPVENKQTEPDGETHPAHTWGMLRAYAWGMLEAIQTACSRFLKLSVSAAAASEPCSWSGVGEKADSLKFILSSEDGSGAEMVLIDERELYAPKTGDSAPDPAYPAPAYEQRFRYKMKGLGLLESYLERGEEAAFLAQFHELAQTMEGAPATLRLEFFCSLSVLLLSCINRRDAAVLAPAGISLDKLTDLKLHASWKEAIHYFAYVAGQLFRLQEGEQNRSQDHLIERLHDHINQHLCDDLSLTRLASLVHLHPFYLSRLYVRLTGISLSDYITQARMAKAKELLAANVLKIHEISSAVGYEFAPSFSRIFKKLWGMTPQEFRDQSNR